MIEFLTLALILAVREVMHYRERGAWETERRALVEKLTGVRFVPLPVDEGPERAFGSDMDEWRIEQARLKAGGYEQV